MKWLWNCLFGPKLFKIYAQQSINYSPNGCEKLGNNIIKGVNIMWNIGIYTSPFIITYLYRKDYFCFLGCISLTKLATGIWLLLVVGMILRGLGRSTNSAYHDFLKVLQQAPHVSSVSNKNALAKYDFEFWAWPTDFSVKEIEGEESKPFTQVERSLSKGKVGPMAWILSLPCTAAAFCCIHLFGRHLIYPGSIHLLQSIMESLLTEGREKLVRVHGGRRAKVVTRDGNTIDTMFVDRRHSKRHVNGSTLVICCEGNAGFYEVGLMSTPLEAGYSVLGWNHPGFAGSTGTPLPSQEQHAVDAVMQLALHQLGFEAQEVLVYAWSIGGYAGTWLAMNYPQVRGLILDATFDDLVPLAVPRMPVWMGGLVRLAVRRFMDLDVAGQACRFGGPVTLVRRTRDEIITTVEGDIATNRGNNLLLRLLQHRYPNLYASEQASTTLQQWLKEDQKMQDVLYGGWRVDEEAALAELTSFSAAHGASFPLLIGGGMSHDHKTKMLLFIAQKILVNFNSTHNNPLDPQYFKVPWTPMTDPTFVQL